MKKERLLELAGLANLKPLTEAVSDNTPITLELKLTYGQVKKMIESNTDYNFNIDDTSDVRVFQEEAQEDLTQWFSNNGGQWFDEGINSDLYMDFTTYKQD